MTSPPSLPLPQDPAEPRHWHQIAHAPAPGAVLGQRNTLPDGSATLRELAPGSDTASAPGAVFRYLLLRSGSGVRAFVNRCAHFGVPLAARQDLLQFVPHERITCNVHYAHYRWTDGLCTSGDCEGESLLPIPVVVEADGTVRVAP
jgi:nitrite reductase/ring-hydroxylating ferredoxin subunit